MKLSEAILMGDSLRTRDYNAFLFRKRGGKYCGCAIGGACLALGHTEAGNETRLALWPWLSKPSPNMPEGAFRNFEADIGFNPTVGFKAVCKGKATIEQLADYVASVEPACGECNRFDCTCSVPVETSVEERELIAK